MKSPSNDIRALSVGHATHDLYGDRILAGGSALYAAVVFKGLGADPGLVTAVGDDYRFFGDLERFSVFRVPSETTSTFENTYPACGDRLMLVQTPASAVTPDCVPESWCSPDVLFLAPVVGEVPIEPWLSRISARVVGAGLQGFLKGIGAPWRKDETVHLQDPHLLDRREFNIALDVLSQVSAIFVSTEDIAVSGAGPLIETLIQAAPLLVVTDGSRGATVYVDRGKIRFHAGIRATTVVDPTGAGDTFAAGFLFALAKGYSSEDAARLAAAAASLMVEDRGILPAAGLWRAADLASEIRISSL